MHGAKKNKMLNISSLDDSQVLTCDSLCLRHAVNIANFFTMLTFSCDLHHDVNIALCLCHF